jgi:hypothetical protein
VRTISIGGHRPRTAGRQLQAVHRTRHIDVREHNPDVAAPFQNGKGLVGARRLKHRKASAFTRSAAIIRNSGLLLRQAREPWDLLTSCRLDHALPFGDNVLRSDAPVALENIVSIDLIDIIRANCARQQGWMVRADPYRYHVSNVQV